MNYTHKLPKILFQLGTIERKCESLNVDISEEIKTIKSVLANIADDLHKLNSKMTDLRESIKAFDGL